MSTKRFKTGLLFYQFFSKPNTENNANSDAVSTKCAKSDEVQSFKTYT